MIAIAIGAMALWVAPAFAAPPANDDFANGQLLGGPLPIEASVSNFEAGNESGEFLNLLAAAGHSVWFEWEATETGWVTIGACNPDGDFKDVVGVYTGTGVGALTKVADGNASEGPHCPFTQREYTFKAVSGTKYEVAVDGNAFGFPGQPVPVTEGTTPLRIEATPVPVNDDFADATVLAAPIDEEPGGERFYYATANGYNWRATTEAGEPDDGTSRGASVWYTWTAPESGTYSLSGPCCASDLSWAVYRGDSVGALTPFLIGAASAKVSALAGETYRIVVDGESDPGTGEPKMADFDFTISARLPALPAPSSPPDPSRSAPAPGPDRVAPATTLSKRVLKRLSPVFSFRFESSEPGSSFRCRLDRQAFGPCVAPRSFAHLSPGQHTFRVKAVDAAGNEDPTPASIHFTVPARPPRPQR